MKTLREMMDIIESAQTVAEGSSLDRNKVRAALWYEWQQDPNYQDENGRPLEQTPEEMDQDDYDMFEETVDEIVQYGKEMGIANAAMAVVKYNMLNSDVVQRELTGAKGLAEEELEETELDPVRRIEELFRDK